MISVRVVKHGPYKIYPANTTRLCNDHVVPLARAFNGLDHDPWEPLTDFQLQSILDMVYIPNGHDLKKHGPIPDVKKEPVWHGLVFVGYRLSDWRGNIGRQALEGIEAMIAEARAEPESEPEPEEPEHEGDNTKDEIEAENESPVEEGTYSFIVYPSISDSFPEEDEFVDEYFDVKTLKLVAAYVEWAWRAEGHAAPFHWRRWGQGKKKEGLFEGALIAYAYVSHLVALKAILSCFVPAPNSKPPIAALILCIQATVDRKDVKDRKATKYVRTLLDFTPEQWAAIEDRASVDAEETCRVEPELIHGCERDGRAPLR
ncbi:hypothetical protein B0H17DRAFT_1217522 [Mycena rosella]|uniref:Uncharacterized protein n=1 Tax=Mycena rosella TaxID=1033263 RepID=A0AAD7BXY3_MYCRO|nr:hypothetical protein B0H17DRAFT_1217522 [Mycena rosella]